MMYTKCLCKKSHAECPMIHNPTCWHFSNNNGKCLKGDRCLFPHRDLHKSGQFVSRSDDAQAPADRGGQPQATSQGEAKVDKGKNKNQEQIRQGALQRLGESVISSSSELNAGPGPESSAGRSSSARPRPSSGPGVPVRRDGSEVASLPGFDAEPSIGQQLAVGRNASRSSPTRQRAARE